MRSLPGISFFTLPHPTTRPPSLSRLVSVGLEVISHDLIPLLLEANCFRYAFPTVRDPVESSDLVPPPRLLIR